MPTFVVMRRSLGLLVLVGVAAAVIAGLSQRGSSSRLSATSTPSERPSSAALAPELAAVHAEANELLDGSPRVFLSRLRRLEGHPMVVNKWASWCAPCRAEFGLLAQGARRFGDRVAFLGVNVSDRRRAARAFLDRFPLPYPSYFDPGARIAAALGVPEGQPITIAYDRRGQATPHAGPFLSSGDLATWINRYALKP